MLLLTSDGSAVLIVIFLGIAALALYFLPIIVASRRGHHQENSIALLNFFLGWTFIGWLVALIWSVSAVKQPAKSITYSPSQRTERPCPACAEPILVAASKCKHCGSEIEPAPPPIAAPPQAAQIQFKPMITKPGMSGAAKFAIAMIVGAGVLSLAMFLFATRDRETTPIATASTSLPPLTSAEHLAAAEKIAAKKNGAASELIAARVHLAAIPKDATERQRADALSKTLESGLKAIRDAEEIERNPLVVVSSNWHKGGFGVIGLWTVTFKNRSKKSVGDLKFSTEYYSETGNQVSHTRSGLIQKIIPANTSRTIEVNDGFVDSEAAKASFKLTGWEYVDGK